MTRTTLRFPHALLLGAALLAACGDDDDAPVADASMRPDVADTIDAGAALGCDKLDAPVTTLSTFPASYTGSLAGANASLQVTEPCDFQQGPDQLSTVGPEQIVKLTGLTAGTRYFAKVESPEADLVIDVIVGCSEAISGPGKGQCLGLSDIVVTGYEIVPFEAPVDGVAYLVVDTYDATELTDPAYTVTVDTGSCLEDDDCPEATPFCNPGFVCEATDVCVNDSECPASAPFCEETQCTARNLCVGDDTEAENRSDDSPRGATPLDLGTGSATVSANICGDPVDERDFYSFIVADATSVAFAVDWSEEGADMDVYVYDSSGENEVAVSWYEHPEDITVSFLPAGTYYLAVVRYLPAGTAVTPYTVTATATTAKCTDNADCSEAFEDQYIRGSCDLASGACVPLEGGGTVANGGICDSDDDCTGEFCTSFPHTAGADTRYICSAECATDTECVAVAATARCTSGFDAILPSNFCLLPCTSDEQCPVNLLEFPVSGPWFHATCTDGRCVLP